MKAKERHDLKQNDFAAQTARVLQAASAERGRLLAVGIGAVVVLVLGGGVLYWMNGNANKAGALLGIAISTSQAQIAPASTLPGATQVAGTYPTLKARSEAALAAYQAVISAYPSSDAALTAKFDAAGELLSLGRLAEAETNYNEVIATGSKVYAPMARLGLARIRLASGKYDDAVKMFTDLSAERDSALPVDGVLMQLAEAYTKAGKPQDARAAYKRVVDEFPDSPYAQSARQLMTLLG